MRPSWAVGLVAIYEAVKGVLALAVGAGVLSLLHHDVASAAEQLARHLHLNPARNHPRIFADVFSGIHDTQLVVIAVGAALYALLRLVLAGGLWRGRAWAEWLTAISAGFYIPLEIYELSRGLTPIRAATFVGNVLIVLFMIHAIRKRRAAQATGSCPAPA
jgi:uncharacterized membrane protein (DUF2068 family)